MITQKTASDRVFLREWVAWFGFATLPLVATIRCICPTQYALEIRFCDLALITTVHFTLEITE
jgi:hypothetical protein